MALADDLPDDAQVAFDTNSIIYYIEQNREYFQIVQPAVLKAVTGSVTGHLSLVTLIEVLVKPLRENQQELVQRYRRLLTGSRAFFLHDLNQDIAERAAEVRARWNLRVPDAIVAATALAARCTYVVTNDPSFNRVEGFEALIIDDYV